MGGASQLLIRQAVREDVPLLFRMIRELAEFEQIPHEVSATEEIMRESLFGTAPAAEALLAEYGGEPAGFVVCFRNFSTFVGKAGLYIEDLYVRPEFRGLGVGKALFLRCVEIARARDLGRVEWAVLEWNPARTFYERFGARSMDDWILYRLGGDALETLGRMRGA